jgi:tyrosyl-tRNA synthetase
MPLIEGTDGKIKMSKSYPQHCINLTDTPADMFGKLMSIPDELIIPYMERLTSCTADIVAHVKRQMDSGAMNPRDVKAELAKALVADYYSRDDALRAEEAFIRQFRNNEIPADIPDMYLTAQQFYHLPTLMMDQQLAPSKAEARRLIQGGGVKLAGQKVTDPDYEFSGRTQQEIVLQVGRRRFLRLLFQ